MAHSPIACIDITNVPERGTSEWNLLCSKVREALEMQGFLLIQCPKPSEALREQMFTSMHHLFDLPLETKRRNATQTPHYTYVSPSPVSPLYESLAIIKSTAPGELQAFTQLMWPEGNRQFCQTLSSMITEMLHVMGIIISAIYGCYGVRIGDSDADVQKMDALFRMIKYSAPTGDEPASGLRSHTDRSYLTLLCSNEVEGLVVQTRKGEWIQVHPPSGSLVAFAGDAFRVWSNGRLHAPAHEVVLTRPAVRFCCGLFLSPRSERVVEAMPEFVDDEHPRQFKAFTYIDYLDYAKVNACRVDKVLDGYLESLALSED